MNNLYPIMQFITWVKSYILTTSLFPHETLHCELYNQIINVVKMYCRQLYNVMLIYEWHLENEFILKWIWVYLIIECQIENWWKWNEISRRYSICHTYHTRNELILDLHCCGQSLVYLALVKIRMVFYVQVGNRKLSKRIPIE